MSNSKIWNIKEAQALFNEPLLNLIFEAQKIHRKNFVPNTLQMSTLLSIKTGRCPEDCKYCSQSSRYKTGLNNQNLIDIEKIIDAAKNAKKSGSTRFCMGAAWRNPKDRDIPKLEKIIKIVKNMGLETCMTLGSLSKEQACKLSKAGLDFYNHNLDSSPEFYSNIVTTRSYQERLDTLKVVRESGIKLCSGGIIGLGETIKDRASFLVQLANLPHHPESVPINMLVKIPGTPFYNNENVEPFDFIRVIAIARIMMPKSYIRLSAGRKQMNEQTQALCFISGVNSIFYGCKLLTSSNPSEDEDMILFKKLGLKIEKNKINTKKHIQDLKNYSIIQSIKSDIYYDATK